LSYKLFEDEGIMMPVLHLSCKYLKPALYDDLLTVRTTIKKFPSVRIEFLYEIFNEAGVLLNQGETTLVCINMKTQRPCDAPEKLINALKPYFDKY
ncbi:MAG: acyl-CoA thioesterase, partial [Bacteroidia bacterium]|nr:acyl-CoA thioesterase [Bacteroidia bacterium]